MDSAGLAPRAEKGEMLLEISCVGSLVEATALTGDEEGAP